MLSETVIQALHANPPSDLAGKVAATIGRGLVPAKDVAEACGVTVQAINGWKNNGRVGKQHIKTLSRLTGLPVSWWLPGDDDVADDLPPRNGEWPFRNIDPAIIRGLPQEKLSHLEGVLLFALGTLGPTQAGAEIRLPAPAARKSGLAVLDDTLDAFPMAPVLPAAWEPQGLTTKQIERIEVAALKISREPDVGHVADAGYSANDRQFLRIPEMDVRLAAGRLGIENYHETEIGEIQLRKSFLDSFGLPVDRMKIVYADGHSMEPVIRHRSPMLFYEEPLNSFHQLDSRTVYAINQGGEMIVKCIVRSRDGTWLARSLNPAFPDFPLSQEDGKDVRVVGRILWSPYDLRNGVDERLLNR